MHVENASNQGINQGNATDKRSERWRNKPRYARDMIWEPDGMTHPSASTVTASMFEDPIPDVPQNEHLNTPALTTIRRNPHLFQIITPINIDLFESYLSSHPNRPFVLSVCRGLREGFWPWAVTDDPTYPVTHDNSFRPITCDAHRQFVIAQRDEEIALGQFSPSFGTELLPGMYSMPIGVVPKKDGVKLRMVVDQSAEPFSQNSMIPKEARVVRMDRLKLLGDALLAARRRHPGRCLIVFKSDILCAYRLIPVHPLWQICQIVTIEGERHVNRCNHFGNGAGGRVFASFACLLSWIATYIILLLEIFTYVDDNFSWEFEIGRASCRERVCLLV